MDLKAEGKLSSEFAELILLDDNNNRVSKKSLPKGPRWIALSSSDNRLNHAANCSKEDCNQACRRMKHLIEHSRLCKHRVSRGNPACSICKQLFVLYVYHAGNCDGAACGIPFCTKIKCKLMESKAKSLPLILIKMLRLFKTSHSQNNWSLSLIIYLFIFLINNDK